MWPSRTAAHQVPLSMGFPSQEYWSCHFLLQGIFLTQGSNPRLLRWQADSLPLSHITYYTTMKLQKVTQSPFSHSDLGNLVLWLPSKYCVERHTSFGEEIFFSPSSWHFEFTFIIALVHLNVNILWDEVTMKSLVCTVLFSILFSKVPAIWDLLKNYFCIYFIFGYVWSWLWHAGSFLVAQCSLFLGALELSHCAQAYSLTPGHVGSKFPDQGLNLHLPHWKADS